MNRSDAQTDAVVAAARADYRAVARTPRLAGFGLVVVALVILWGLPELGVDARLVQTLGYGALAGGWALMLYAIFARTRYLRRLREQP